MSTVETEAAEFSRRLGEIFTGSVLSKLIRIGHATGLLEAAARAPRTSAALASELGLTERYVREWLGGMVTGGILDYDPGAKTYHLPPGRAAALTGTGSGNLAPVASLLEGFGLLVPEIERCLRQGGGVPYDAYRPAFTEAMDDLWRRVYDDELLDGFLPAAPTVVRRLQEGCRAADVGCGTGHAINLMAAAFPRSSLVGYDLAPDAIARARDEASHLGLSNATFEVLDAAQLAPEPPYDVLLAFDAIHDQADPAGVLRRIHDALAPGGTFFMVDLRLSSDLAANLDDPFAPMTYGVSLLHCMPVSLAVGGAGLGAAWGIEKAQELLAAAGFDQVEVVDSPRPQNCIFLCQG
jgi:SAM-dependent methyltransferase